MLQTVTQVCRSISQPRGGYINPSDFEVVSFDDGVSLYEQENISPGFVGMVVDYMTRFSIGFDLFTSFLSSIKGAGNISREALRISAGFGREIKGLDDNSIINACKLVSFDDAFRHSRIGGELPDFDAINPDPETVSNIRTLVNRGIHFWNEYGPVVEVGFTFESAEQKKKGGRDSSSLDAFISGGYTYSVANGEGDYLTKDTLWDFKVSKQKPKSTDTLQILMYWIMGQHSSQEVYKGINKIGIFNPRLNTAYILEMNKVHPDIISTIENDIIQY